MNRTLIRNTASNYAGKIVNLGVWFVLTPFILAHLGQAMFGLWVLVGSIAAYGSLLDLGIAGAVVKYVAEYHARADRVRAGSVIATALCLYTLLGLAVFGAFAALAPAFASLFHVAEDQRATAASLVVLSGLSIGLSLPLGTGPAVLRGLQRFDLVNVVTTTITLVYASGAVVVLLLGGGAVGLVLVGIGANLAGQLLSVWLIHRSAPALGVHWRGVDRHMLRTVFAFSSSSFLLNLNGYFETKTDEIVVGAALPLAMITPYNLARKLGMLSQTLTEQFLAVIMPAASVLHGQDEPEKLRSLYIQSTRITLALVLPISLTIGVLGDSILSVWVGAEYADYAYLVLIFALVSAIDTSQWPAGLVLQGMARHRLLAIGSLASGIANLVLSIVLVRSIGLAGVAIGTLVPTLLVCLGFVLPYAMRALRVSGRVALTEMLAPALLPALPMLALLLLLKTSLGTDSLWTLGVVASAGVLTYGLGYAVLLQYERLSRPVHSSA